MQDTNSSNRDDEDGKKQGTRVFKKSSPNSKLTVYLGKRDFIDHLSHIDPIDGVVLVDPDYLNGRKVFVHVLAAFRYGREDLDVLGLTFRKDLFLATQQVYPPERGGESDGESSSSRPPTRLQERLLKKLGPNAYPFYFELPSSTPASVTLQPAAGDTGKPCGVDYELRTYVDDLSGGEKANKRSTIQLAIRKLTYAPEEPAPQPTAEANKEFMISSGSLRLEATLDKEKYYHGEYISVNVLVDNNTSKSVKKIKISVRQYADICLFSTAQYKCTVAELESEEGFPIQPSQTGFCKVYTLTPLLSSNRHKRGLALDGKLKHEDTNLASSTILLDPSQKENLGIIVQYKVKVRLILGFGSSDLAVKLPFTLTHPKPVETPPSTPTANQSSLLAPSTPVPAANQQPASAPSSSLIGGGEDKSVKADDVIVDVGGVGGANVAVEGIQDGDLIQLDDECCMPITHSPSAVAANDDLIFEDFARLRLKGVMDHD